MIDASIIAKQAALELKGALAVKQVTLVTVAQLTGHVPASVGRWLSGKQPMSMNTFISICYVAGVAPDEIMRRATINAPEGEYARRLSAR